MPPKVSELIARLEQAGFQNRGGKGSHRNFVHPNVAKPITISGNLGGGPFRLDRCPHYAAMANTISIECQEIERQLTLYDSHLHSVICTTRFVQEENV